MKKLFVYDATGVHLLPLKERIRYHYGPGKSDYHSLMSACFPPKHFPKAWNCSKNGGPPGCAIAFGRALREMGPPYSHVSFGRGGAR